MSGRLTQRELRAISEALAERLAGEIEDVADIAYEDYESAKVKVDGRINWKDSE